MDKQVTFTRLLEICETIRPDKRGKHKHEKQKRLHPSARKLLCILLKEERLNQRSIAELMDRTAQAVSVIVGKLEYRGYLARESGEVNNENIIYLTSKGQAKALEIEQQTKQYTTNLLQDFSDQELETLLLLMEKLYQNHQSIPNQE